MKRPLFHLFLIVALIALATSSSAAEPVELSDLGHMNDLRSAFEAAEGSPRLVLLLSPT